MKWASILVVLLILPCSRSIGREWTDDTGQYHCQAAFVRLGEGNVWLKKADGAGFHIAWERVSEQDRDYVRSQVAACGDLEAAGATNVQRRSLTWTPLPPTLIAYALTTVPKAERGSTTSISKAPVMSAAMERLQRSGDPPPGKRIFGGCCATFQLDGATGTGAYWLCDDQGHCHHYLTLLSYSSSSNGFDIYLSQTHEGGVYAWMFDDHSLNCCGCGGCNGVWFVGATDTAWRFYARSWREIPE
jgi:hypothetical protein